MLHFVLAGLGYLSGAIPVGVLVARRARLADPRAHGSGNVGATNLVRLGGWRAGALTLAGDSAKGALPVLLARAVGGDAHAMAIAAVAAVVGHVWPVTLGFRGGKGVATGAGALAVLAPLPTVAAVVVFAVVAAVTRIASVASLTAAVALLGGTFVVRAPAAVVAAAGGIVALVILRHRDNIRRLLERRELGVRS